MYFDEINFGKARAELESVDYPELIQKGFLDPKGIIKPLINDSPYLVLGYKGSGKSAIAEKIKMESDPESGVMTKIVPLSDFPFASFGKIMAGKEEPEAKFPTTWSWLILLYFLDSFSNDFASSNQKDTIFCRAVSSLSQLGLLPPNDLNTVVTKSSKHSFKVSLPKVLETTFEDTTVPSEMDMQFRRLVDHLKLLIFSFRSPNRHILIIDGLDDILLSKEIQYQSLSALVYETDRLNLAFKQNGVDAKIILICRTDLFERLPGPNKNKIRQDSSFELDWYDDPRKPRNSMLVKLVNLRATVQCGENIDIFNAFFPKDVNHTDPADFLLERTRHTPRDFIQLLNHLKPFYQRRTFTHSQILSGIRQYSVEYFLPEIWDELAGYVLREHFDIFLGTVGSLRRRVNTYPRLLRAATSTGRIQKADFDNLLLALYECSAIGNRWIDKNSGEQRFEFKFRNRHSALGIQNDIVLHSGLWKALNLE